MEVIEDGNIMDRIPILLQRDLEYYQKNQTVLSETICKGVVGGRLDFPRNASFASVKIVLWLEEEFSIAFKQGSGMFVITKEDEKGDIGVAKTSDPDKFVQLAIKSGDSLLEHLHMLAQEALDHADLPVLTATLGAAALLKNSLYCYVQHIEDSGNPERYSQIQGCYKRYTTMSEAVGERVLDLHNRVLSLYILQDSGGRPIDGNTRTVHESGTPSVQGWWLYMNGSRRDLWDTVPPRMAQRIFAGMLNETLTILTVRYCQTNTTDTTTRLLLNDILNILLCVAQLLPSICANGSDLAGLDVKHQTRDVRDVHAKCNELFKCFVYRGADLHFIHQEFKEKDPPTIPRECPFPWFTFVSPMLFDKLDDPSVRSTHDLSNKTAFGLELIVLLAQPQPNWALIVKVLMMRDCHLSRMLLIRAVRHMSTDNLKWPADGLWYSVHDRQKKCSGFLCTADGFCRFKGDVNPGEEFARVAGALTYVLATIGSKAELKSTLCYALEISGREWAACLDKRQVWCDRRPPWLAGILALVGSILQFIPPILVNAVQSGASMYQTMALCLSCISRSLDCVPRCFVNACSIIEGTLPSHINPVGGSVLLQMLVTVTYEEIQKWAEEEVEKEKAGKRHLLTLRFFFRPATSTSLSFDGSHSSASSIALAVAEALCSIDEDDKHTRDIQLLIERAKRKVVLSEQFGLEDFPEFAELFEEGDVPGSNAERASDAAALTSQILMTPPGRDSLRVIYEHLALHSEWIYKELGIRDSCDIDIPSNKTPLLYTMFHIGKQPFDQFLRGEWPLPWSTLVAVAKAWSGLEGVRVHINRRTDVRNMKSQGKSNKQLMQLCSMFKSNSEGLL
ncbi:uncharacterized protein LOC111355673 [Spodoptera litura]|uniref:Uncharacterized protein LOC111355673 n=1 Tax=Spodoptera litura TaxID=69820 RepID=A0A9J7ECF4_SPOLT|nr:uncharacterized protein LOC111355673 [Spodoptera litura]